MTLTTPGGGPCGAWRKGLDCVLREEACPMSPPAPLSSATWKAPGAVGREASLSKNPSLHLGVTSLLPHLQAGLR